MEEDLYLDSIMEEDLYLNSKKKICILILMEEDLYLDKTYILISSKKKTCFP